MGLSAGTVDIDGDGNVTGSGLALAIFEGTSGALSDEIKAKIGSSMKPFCEGLAAAIVDHIQDNAVVTVTVHTTDGALQRTPNPNTANTDTQGPASNKTLSGTVA